jgi:hypothetical protein
LCEVYGGEVGIRRKKALEAAVGSVRSSTCAGCERRNNAFDRKCCTCVGLVKGLGPLIPNLSSP